MTRVRPLLRRPLRAAAAVFLASTSVWAAAELYGKPLRGLTRVPLATLLAEEARYAGKAVRVSGTAAAEPGAVVLKDGDAAVPLRTDGTFSLPEGLAGGAVTAEGKLQRGEKDGLAFVATGVEVQR